MITKENIRNYEVSIWTLQDSFITVLKPYNLEHKSALQDGRITLQDDGENKISFSIPMYIDENGKFIENPLWYNKNEGHLIANLRKIKVVFNKKMADEAIFEFLVTKVTENHEGFSKVCKIEGEGLAYSELGKQGYKIELAAENLYAEVAEAEEQGNTIRNNINYWCDKVFENSNWRYSVQMDWSSYDGIFDISMEEYAAKTQAQKDYYNLTNRAGANLRRRDKIYEDDYVPAWNIVDDVLVPASSIAETEKYRIVEAKESNRYNLIQTIAETFGVFTKFKYYYDDNYHIIDREVIFYNNFLNELGEVIDLTFNYNTQNITRELDGAAVTTKMYVKSLSDDGSPTGLISIVDTSSNKTGEDYLLNFDYLYDTNIISKEQYGEIKVFETKVAKLNKQIIKLEKKIIQLNQDLFNAEVKRDNAAAICKEAEENINASNDVIDNITGGDGLLETTNANRGFVFTTSLNDYVYKGRFGSQYTGILPETLKVYETKDSTTELKFTIHRKNNFVDYITILKSQFSNSYNGTNCYATFQYRPDLVRQETVETYQRVANKNKKIYDKMVKKIDGDPSIIEPATEEQRKQQLGLTAYLEEQKNLYQEKIEEKNQLVAKFENMMGPALREGTWQPEEDYAQYGERNSQEISYVFSGNTEDNSLNADFIWDKELFDEEDENFEYSGIEETKVYYPCIDLSSNLNLLSALGNKEFLKNLIFSYKETAQTTTLQALAMGTNCKVAFIQAKNSTAVKPVLMLLNLTKFEITASNHSTVMSQLQALQQIRVSYLTTAEIDNDTNVDNVNVFSVSNTAWIDPINYYIVYPRIKIKSDYLKTGENELYLGISETLNEYDDYYIFLRDSEYYITIKPETLLWNTTYNNQAAITSKINISYYLSNAALHVYLDAIDVMKENAYPKVTYTVNNIIDKNIMRNAYNRLGQLAHINDAELKLNGAMGYISAVELNLDSPWEDSITIQNYKNKFEDLFSTIVTQTEDMKKNAYKLGVAAGAFSASGQLINSLSLEALSKSKISLNTIIRQNANVITAEAVSDAAKNKAILVSSNAYRIMNGETGLAFKSDKIENLIINQEKGLLIEGILSGTNKKRFFQVTNGRMGFYEGTAAAPTKALLYFEEGDLALAGNIYAQHGWFGGENGWIIGAGLTGVNLGHLAYNNQNYTIANRDLGGLLYSANGKAIFTSGSNSANPMIILSSTGFLNTTTNSADALFLFDGTNLYIKGNITASSGVIGGWKINPNFSSSDLRTIDSLIHGDYFSSADMGIIPDTSGVALWLGGKRQLSYTTNQNTSSEIAPFRVTGAGKLYATNAEISGVIKANTGYIGGSSGWEISANLISSGTKKTGIKDGDISLSTEDFTREINNIPRSYLRFAIGQHFGVAKNGALYSTSGVIGGWTIGGSSLYLNNATPGIDDSLVLSKGTTSSVSIGGSPANTTKTWMIAARTKFGVTTSGDLYANSAHITGEVTATSGTFTGTINATTGHIGGTYTNGVWSSGGWYIGNDYIGNADTLNGSTVGMRQTNTDANKVFWAGAVYNGTPTFSVTKKGYLTSTLGKIGGWTIGTKRLYNKAEISANVFKCVGLKVDGDVAFVAGATGAIDDENSESIWTNAPFRVFHNGTVHAEDAYITGKITATSGTIGGFTISSTADTNTHAYTKSLYGQSSDGTYDYEVGMKSDTSAAVSTGSTNVAFYITRVPKGATWTTNNRQNMFYIRHNGYLFAESAEIKGTIKARAGFIGDTTDGSNVITIGGTSGSNGIAFLYSGSKGTLNADTINGFYLGTNGLALGPGKFKVTDAGVLTATEGNIAGWTIDGDSIFTGAKANDSSIRLSSAGFSRSINNISISNLRLALGTKFGVTNDGTLYASNATVSGIITATSGTFTGTINATTGHIGGTYTNGTWSSGGWYIVDDYIGNADALNSSTVGMRQATNDGYKVFWAGGAYNGTPAFSVTRAGSITATTGTIAGWRIDTSGFHKNISTPATNDTNPGANVFLLCPNGVTGTIGSTSLNGANNGPKWALTAGTNFGVTTNGVLYATGADISGKITATSGKIANFFIGIAADQGKTSRAGGHRYYNSLYTYSYDSTYEYEVGLKSDAQSGSSTNLAFYVLRKGLNETWESTNENIQPMFYVNHQGRLYAQNADITGTINANNGTIGTWHIGSDYIGDANSKNGSTIGIATVVNNNDNSNSKITVFWAGGTYNGTGNNAPKFLVNNQGSLEAKYAKLDSATINGTTSIGGTTSIATTGAINVTGDIIKFGVSADSFDSPYILMNGKQSDITINKNSQFKTLNSGNIEIFGSKIEFLGGPMNINNNSILINSAGSVSISGTAMSLTATSNRFNLSTNYLLVNHLSSHSSRKFIRVVISDTGTNNNDTVINHTINLGSDIAGVLYITIPHPDNTGSWQDCSIKYRSIPDQNVNQNG